MASIFFIDAVVTLNVSMRVSAASKEEAIKKVENHLGKECVFPVKEKGKRSDCQVVEEPDTKIEVLDN